MKIGELSKKYNLSTQTIRYYIKLALLVPDSKNKQYYFSEQDIDDLELILKLKNLDFSLSDIHKALSLKRISNFVDKEDQQNYKKLLQNHLNSIMQEEYRLRYIRNAVEAELEKTTKEDALRSPKQECGISLRFLPYLCCPFCKSSLDIQNMQVTNLQIISGDLHCSCGYHASVREGILYVEGGHISSGEVVDFERRYYKDSPNSLVSLYQKSYNWMIKEIKALPLENKVVLEPLVNTSCFLFPNIRFLNRNALYIIIDKHQEIIKCYKEALEQLNLDFDILFMVDATYHYPLKPGCVDLFIDYNSTTEYFAYENQGHLLDKINPYLHSGSNIIGALFCLNRNSKSHHNFQKRFPDSHPSSMMIQPFWDYMHSQPLSTQKEEYLGFVTDSGDGGLAFSYHVPGDKLSLYMYQYKVL